MYSNRGGHLIVALLAVLAFASVAAAAAQAAEAPFWSIKGTRLTAGKTHFITGKVYAKGVITLKPPNVTVTCSMLKLKEGVILGSNEGEPGTNDEIIEFESCSQTGNGTACTVAEPIVSTSLKSELVEDATGKKLYVEFMPAVGNRILTINYNGTCTRGSSIWEGAFAGEVLTDPGEEPVELPNTKKEATSWLIKFPETPITEVLLTKDGKSEEVKEEIKSEGGTASLIGILLILLANAKRESIEEDWSPLP